MRWHGKGRLRYAVTPRFSLSTCDEMLDGLRGRTLRRRRSGSPRTSTRTCAEIATVAGLFPGRGTTSTPTTGTAWSPPAACSRTTCTPATTSWTCWPSRALRSRTARRATARWAAVCSRCAGTSSTACGSRWAPTWARAPGFSCRRRGCRPTSCSSCSAPDGLPLTPAHLLYLATRAGAGALGLADRVGDLAVGKEFDAVWLRPADGSTLAVNLRHARDTSDALARIFALATPADVAGVWLKGEQAYVRAH